MFWNAYRTCPVGFGINGSPDASSASLHPVTVVGLTPNQSSSDACSRTRFCFFAIFLELLCGLRQGLEFCLAVPGRDLPPLRGGIYDRHIVCYDGCD